ncbi:MAG: NAD(P)H-hydrate dehydratase [Geobacteraceae bacterium]|nr:NAD(P)H-hydrate dehydratase [Geobacteraceae bacterium]
MKIVTAHTMQELDRRAINEYGIPGRDLMERAGRGCAEHILAAYGTRRSKRVVILAGKGNNGGDGYVIARYLLEKEWQVLVIVLANRDSISGDAETNLVLLPEDSVRFCPGEGELTEKYTDDLQQADVLVDALLGTGLRSDLTGVYREAVEQINAAPGKVVAVDIPTGIHGTTGRILGQTVHANMTVTFGIAKLGHVLYPAAEHVGRLVIVDIGIPPQLMEEAVGYDFLNEKLMAPLVKRRDRQAHKGTYGHCLIVAGSTGKTGAAALAANSAVRTGSGLVTLAVPESINQILEIKTTEAMTLPLPDAGSGHLTIHSLVALEKQLAGKDALAIGPGIDRRPASVTVVQTLIETVSIPMVIDADGLNALAEDTSILHRRRSPNIVLTPHPGEMSRLLGSAIPDVAAIRISVAQEFARTFGVHVVLKGARTIIAAPNGMAAINGSGNPGMASGGMGDVLTGIIVSLLGQGYSAWNACRLGVFIHGLAGDLVAMEQGEIGMTATDLMARIPLALNRLLNLPANYHQPA